MYKIEIKNGNKTTLIHDGSTSAKSDIRVIGGKISKAVNSIDSFTFTIYPNNAGYKLLNGMTTKIEVTEIASGKKLFTGRVLRPTDSMDNSGLICKSVICEGRLGWLYDSVQPYAEYTMPSLQSVLYNFLQNHNMQVEDDKKINLGAVTVDASNSYHYTKNWDSTMQTITDKLVDKFGGELQIRDGDDGKVYLDYLDRIGRGTDTKIELAVNLQSITREVDETSVITRLYPLGAKATDSEKRLTVGSVNAGKDFIEDASLVAKYGVICGTQVWDDVTEATNLLQKAKKYFQTINKVKKQYTITALDLSKIGMNFETFELGNPYRVINPLMEIDEDLRIIAISINLDSPESSELTFGDKFETMTGFTANKSKSLEKAIDESEFRNRAVIDDKIDNATQLITGAKGGHVILDPSEKPERILIMDTADISTCTSCIQLNKNGLGFWNKSKNGGSAKTGPYTNAWTIDGNLVASFITALTLTGLKINNGNGTFKVDEDGAVVMKSATISDATGNQLITINGNGITLYSNGFTCNMLAQHLNFVDGQIKCGSGISDSYFSADDVMINFDGNAQGTRSSLRSLLKEKGLI